MSQYAFVCTAVYMIWGTFTKETLIKQMPLILLVGLHLFSSCMLHREQIQSQSLIGICRETIWRPTSVLQGAIIRVLSYSFIYLTVFNQDIAYQACFLLGAIESLRDLWGRNLFVEDERQNLSSPSYMSVIYKTVKHRFTFSNTSIIYFFVLCFLSGVFAPQ